MRALKTMAMTFLGVGFALGLAGCTVYVVPAEERGASAETMVEADEQGSEETAETENADQPPEREVRRRDDSAFRDSAAAEAEREARAREEAEREARAEAERQARAEAERQAREEAERLAREEAERQARLQAERDAAAREAHLREEREAAERAAREREARLAAEREAAERNAQSRARVGSRELHVPPGHHPPEGQCRIWYEDRPPGRQPDAAPCDELLDHDLEPGFFILYGGESWDGSHDWEAAELEYPGVVPRSVLVLSRVVGGDEHPEAESQPTGSSGHVEEEGSSGSSDAPEDRPVRGRSGSSRGPR